MLLELNDLLGKPYKAHGRGPDGYDCYGLVIEVEKRLGKDMPDLYKKLSEGEDIHNASCVSQKAGYRKVDKAEFGDVVVFFNQNGQIHHSGVCLKNGDFVHCDKYGVRISQLDTGVERKEVYRCLN